MFHEQGNAAHAALAKKGVNFLIFRADASGTPDSHLSCLYSMNYSNVFRMSANTSAK
jgi:hypothetical protein